jgi:hypothetical protein
VTGTPGSDRRARAGLLLAALLWVASGGCSGKPTGSVSGKVTFQDRPMPGGFVNFFSIGPDGALLAHKSATIDRNGDYAVSGVPVGKVKITVQAPLGALEETLPEKGGMPRRGKPPVVLPPHYEKVEQTDLEYTVTAGQQTHDVVLKDVVPQ